MAMYTKKRDDMGVLAYQHTDPSLNFAFENIMQPLEMPYEAGQFREMNERANFLEREFKQTKLTKAQVLTFGDSLRNFNITPIAGGFEFSNVDLAQPGLYGKTSENEMIGEQQGIVSLQMKKYIEKDLYTKVSDNDNFESSSYYNNAGTAWSSIGTANMKDDVRAGKLVLKGGPYRLTMSNTAFEYALDNVSLNASNLVANSMDPAGFDAVRRYLGVQQLVVTAGELIDDSGDPTDTGKTEIWGDKVLLERIGNPSLMQPSWAKHLFFAPLGRGRGMGGWFTVESGDDDTGGVGVKRWATWNYYNIMIQEKTMAYRIDGVY